METVVQFNVKYQNKSIINKYLLDIMNSISLTGFIFSNMCIAFWASVLRIKAIIVLHIPALIAQPAGTAAHISEAV